MAKATELAAGSAALTRLTVPYFRSCVSIESGMTLGGPST